MSRAALIVHAVVSVALIAAYGILEALGHSDTALLGLLVGYLGGVAAQRGVAETGKVG